jgi:putative protease
MVVRKKLKSKAKKSAPKRTKKNIQKRKPVKVHKKKASRVRANKAEMAKIKALGKVTHFYDRISVAIVELEAPLKLGDLVCFKLGDKEFLTEITSLQINHENIEQAKRGDIVGMKVEEEVPRGALVLPA